jgi:CDP-paratose 2-epimerase
LDNLRRRGSEFNLPTLKAAGIHFVHGDIRCREDLSDLPGHFDLMIEASAEPSVLAGVDGSPDYLLNTNLVGSINCLEFARRRVGAFLFLSTSRVYSLDPLKSVPLIPGASRFILDPGAKAQGLSARGIAEEFPTDRARSLYGASKLASEILAQEYARQYGLKTVINRCGVIAGPGQFGKVDQGVFTLWVANHHFQKPLQYFGYGGTGFQVRDLLHPEDLYQLIKRQWESVDRWDASTYNIGGGSKVSVSLAELTQLAQSATGREVPIGIVAESHGVDIPWFITDSAKAERAFAWQPQHDVNAIVADIAAWIRSNENTLRPLFA